MTQIEKAKQAVAGTRVRPMSTQVAEVRQHINLIQEAMKATMKKDVHFGTIPGCPKPSLYKAGAEVILALFKLATDPEVTDLSKDGEIRYQVKVKVTAKDGSFVGSGIGECSSGEDKYMWRAALCQEEFEATSEISRRIKFKKNTFKGTIDQIQQVRVSPSDMANTILKMAKKRALIDAVLTATGASDIFSQDIEDLPEGYIPPEAVPEAKTAEQNQTQASEQGQSQESATHQEETPKNGNSAPKTGNLISDAQGKRLYAISKGAGIEDLKSFLIEKFGIEHSNEITREQYDEICTSASKGWRSA